MTPATLVFTGNTVEDCQCTLLARVCAIAGTGSTSPVASEGKLIKQADVSSISVKAFDEDGTQIGSTQTATISTTIFDTIQTSETWALIPSGGNFRYTCPTSFFPVGGDTVRVEVLITLTDGIVCPVLFDIGVEDLKQS